MPNPIRNYNVGMTDTGTRDSNISMTNKNGVVETKNNLTGTVRYGSTTNPVGTIYYGGTDAQNALKDKYYNTGNNDDGGDKHYYYNNSSDSDSGYGHDHYADLLGVFRSQAEAARDAAIEAIMKNLEAVRGSYNTQIDTVGNDYDRLINENELRKERARRVTRENQANRGQLESGLGRQELLNQNIGYDTQTSNLKSARSKAISDIYNLITQAESEAESNKANVLSNYANSLLQYRLASM